jgi:hypothetical protein
MSAGRLVSGLAAAAAAVLLTASQASAAPAPGFYFLSLSTGTFQPQHSGNLVHGTVDDALFGLSTGAPGPRRLPFPLHVYNQTFRTAVVSANGDVQLGVTVGQASAQPVSECLPSRAFPRPTVLPFWDDLQFDSGRTVAGASEGIYLHTAGSAPHRTFLISWQGRLRGTRTVVLAQALFREGSQTLTFRYGRFGGDTATIGVQAQRELTQTQLNCDAGGPIVQTGTVLTFVDRRVP